MTVILLGYSILALLLLLLNAFFVLAEFAVVKMRASRIEELAGQGSAKAKLVQKIQANLEEYLSVCQVGITVASISLGAVAERGFAEEVMKILGVGPGVGHTVAVTIVVILASALHVVLGEQVPKMMAIRRPEGASLLTARPLRGSWFLFYLPLVLLNSATTGILRLLGVRGAAAEDPHSEEELRIILAHSQTSGLMSFRRLLYLENIFDLAEVRVRDIMRLRDGVKVLRLGVPWEENFKVLRESRFSRFPLMAPDEAMPVGIIHIKDLLYEGPEKLPGLDLRKIARPFVTASEDMPLETLMGELQRHRGHLALVKNAEGRWSGAVSLEDIIEEITGNIEDEFEVEPPIFLADALAPDRVVLGVQASSIEEAVGQAFGRLRPEALPLPAEKVCRAVLERERAMSTYLGNGLAIPHARLEGLAKPSLVFVRSEEGIPVPKRGDEKAHLLFILLTPSGAPRAQVRLLARICGLVDSEYVKERLLRAESAVAVVDAVRAAEHTAI